jgi:dipeptidase E
MRKIVAIGGGELRNLETLPIDKEIVKLTGKKHPKALIIPTASNDSGKYWETFKNVYGKKLGCKTRVLYLIKEKPTKNQIKEGILSSDLIYIGGGDTKKMLKVWRKLNVDKILKMAYDKGIVLSGISAGSYCWFEKSISSSKERVYNGLGLIKKLSNVCHYPKDEKKKKIIWKNFRKVNLPTIALENCTALEIVGDEYRIITSKKRAKAYRLYNSGKKLIKEKITQTNSFKPLADLLFKR